VSITPHRIGSVVGPWFGSTLLATVIACGSTTEPELASVLHAEVVDPSGDVTNPPSGSPSPDIVRVEAEVARDSVTFRVRFESNTYDSLTTNTFIQVDTDQNPATGSLISPFLGMDYMVVAQRTQSLGSRAGIRRCPGPGNLCPEETGDVPVRYVINGLDLTIPLAFLGGDDGRLSFRVEASGLIGVTRDYAPNENLSPATTR
jgi:hypothetical protein